MSVYIEEKLIEIEQHAKNLLNQEDPTGEGLNQEYQWIIGCLDSIRIEVNKLSKQKESSL